MIINKDPTLLDNFLDVSFFRMNLFYTSCLLREVGRISNLGGTALQGLFFIIKERLFLEVKRVLHFFFAKSREGARPSVDLLSFHRTSEDTTLNSAGNQ